MSNVFQIVERTPTEALKYSLRQHNISLPDGLMTDALSLIASAIMEIEVSQLIDASRYERNGSRRAYRNGYRESAWLLEKDSLAIRIPKLRSGTYYPSFLDNSQAEAIIRQFIYDCYTQSTTYDALITLLDTLEITARPDQIANLEELLYDLMTDYKYRLLSPSLVQLDVIPVDDKGRKRYLALAFDDRELLDHDLTSDADEIFWQDFVRRINGRSIHGVEYIAVSRVRTVVRLTKTSTPNMALVA